MKVLATPQTLAKIVGLPAVTGNMIAVIEGLKARPAGITTGARFVHFIAQVAHESGRFKYDEELWGPTAAQRRYEGRADLGNTQPGDGYKFRGRGPIQVTGRYNTARFRDWCRAQGMNPPDFVEDPDKILTDPWEGLSPIWYWETHDLNVFADRGDLKTVTRRINGGYNGLRDRWHYFDRAALVVLGYEPSDIRRFQRDKGLTADGVPGPITRKALQDTLKPVKVIYKELGLWGRLIEAIFGV